MIDRQRGLRLAFTFAVGAATLGTIASLLGLTMTSLYAPETDNWEAQATGQDLANLFVAFPVLVISAWRARNGSLAAHLVLGGAFAYTAYTYAIYSFSIHFNELFLVYVAVFGLALYGLLIVFLSFDRDAVASAFAAGTGATAASRFLIGVGIAFYLLWLADVVPAMLAGKRSDALIEAGLIVNPVHVLDMAILLPAAITAGWLLHDRKPTGYLLAPVLVTCFALLSISIAVAAIVLIVRGDDAAAGPAVLMTVMTVLGFWVLARLLRPIATDDSQSARPAGRSRPPIQQ